MKRFIALSTVFVLIFSLAFSGCGYKSALTQKKFFQKAEAQGLQTKDLTEENKDYPDILTGSLAYYTSTEDPSDKWEAEFYELSDIDIAKLMYDNNKADFVSAAEESETGSHTETIDKNYAAYEQEFKDKYQYVCYVDNTLLFIDTSNKHADDIKKFIESLGY